MTSVGFVVHGGREPAVRTAAGLIRAIAGREVEVRVLDDDPIHFSAASRGVADLAPGRERRTRVAGRVRRRARPGGERRRGRHVPAGGALRDGGRPPGRRRQCRADGVPHARRPRPGRGGHRAGPFGNGRGGGTGRRGRGAPRRDRLDRTPLGAQRGHGGEGHPPPGRAGGRVPRRRVRDDVLRRRRHRGDLDRFHGLLVLRAGADRVAARPVPGRDPDRRTHGVRPVVRDRCGRGRRDRGAGRGGRGAVHRRQGEPSAAGGGAGAYPGVRPAGARGPSSGNRRASTAGCGTGSRCRTAACRAGWTTSRRRRTDSPPFAQ